MKATLILTALFVVASACNEIPQVDPSAARREANKALIIELNDAQNARDYERVASLMAPDIKRHAQATPGAPVSSSAEYVNLIKSWETGVPDFHQTINQILAEGDRVAVHVTFSGTNTGPMEGMPATGEHFDSNALAIFRIENNLIAEAWVEWDNLAILTQLGLFPPPETGL